jgi:tetratricopeptide (TPR) repeat protein
MESSAELFARAKRESEAGNHREAARLARQVADLYSRDRAADKKRAVFYLFAASEHADANAIPEAIADCHSAVAIDPESAIAWRSLGDALFDAGQNAEAEKALLRSIELSPSRSAFIYLGCVCIVEERFVEGEAYCRRALELDPDFDEAYYNLGSALREQGRLDESIDAFQNAARLSPDYAEAHRELGDLFSRLGNLDEAKHHLDMSLALNPHDERTLALLERISQP